MSYEDRLQRVSDILPYFRGFDVALLVFRPLWWSCFLIALMCIVALLAYIGYQYVADPPGGAYVEKIVWCLLLYCCFEALHHYAFVKAKSWESYGELNLLGWYASIGVLTVLCLFMILRLRFIQSIEGRYYERRLGGDATRITRWRDACDTWVLRQFMDPSEIERRFLVKPRTDGDLKSEDQLPR